MKLSISLWSTETKQERTLPAIAGFFLLIAALLPTLPAYAFDPQVAGRRSDSALPATATIENAPFHEIRESMIDMVRSGEAPSISAAVAQGGKIVWEESFGWADRENMIPATPDTTYSIASISKPITATGLMTLVERGLVALDEPVNTYIAPAQLTAHEGNGF